MHDLTDAVARIVSESGVRTGIMQIFNAGSTAAIGAIEFEPGLKQDLPAFLRRLCHPAGITPTSKPGTTARPFPFAGDAARSEPDGARARWPARARRLAAGIFQIECDIRPRERTVVVTMPGE
jgi:thiamine phosphate synthase YjbQ (UPF0047 family)